MALTSHWHGVDVLTIVFFTFHGHLTGIWLAGQWDRIVLLVLPGKWVPDSCGFTEIPKVISLECKGDVFGVLGACL
jgi:hypothetical protein